MKSSSPDQSRKENNMTPTLVADPTQVTNIQTASPLSKKENYSPDASSLNRNMSQLKTVTTHSSKEVIMNRRIRTVFILAIVAAVLCLAGQANTLGLSATTGFGAAIVFLLIAFVVAIPQLRSNFRSGPDQPIA